MNQVIIIYLCEITTSIIHLEPKRAKKESHNGNPVSSAELKYKDGKT